MTVAEALEKAADVCERGWCQNALALDADGREVGVHDQEAVSWCIVGALCVVDPEAYIDVTAHLRDVTDRDFIDWNNAPDRTQGEVVAKLREAAALARARGL